MWTAYWISLFYLGRYPQAPTVLRLGLRLHNVSSFDDNSRQHVWINSIPSDMFASRNVKQYSSTGSSCWCRRLPVIRVYVSDPRAPWLLYSLAFIPSPRCSTSLSCWPYCVQLLSRAPPPYFTGPLGTHCRTICWGPSTLRRRMK